MQGKTAAIIGASGLIGSCLLNQLLNDPHYMRIKAIVRRPLSISDSKLEMVVIDFSDLQAFAAAIAGSDVVFCAVGTTQQKVKGDKAAYRMVDYYIPVTAAKLSAEQGIKQFLLVSSVGADSKAGNFYLKLKGEVEDAIRSMNLLSVSIFRPSMLLGNRKESRPAERVGQVLMKSLSFLIPSKYKPISAQDVASAMIKQCNMEQPGVHVFHFAEMKARAAHNP